MVAGLSDEFETRLIKRVSSNYNQEKFRLKK